MTGDGYPKAEGRSDVPITVREDPDTIDPDSLLLSDYPSDTEEIDLTHMKVSSLRALGLQRFTNVKSVCFRQNIITSMKGIDDLPEDLEILDLYDNRLEHMDHRLEHFGSPLVNLDLSFNNIRHIKHLEGLVGLKDLYLCQNDLSRIQGVETLVNLRNLELGANRIREIKGLEKLVNLEELWLARNKITKIQGLENLKKLRLLSIQSNRISRIEGLEELQNLEELYISYNDLENIEGLDRNKHLHTVDVSHNRIAELSGLAHLEELEELWSSSNQLTEFACIERELKHLPNFHTIYLEHNPLHKASGPMYRKKVMLALGNSLKQIDATPTV